MGCHRNGILKERWTGALSGTSFDVHEWSGAGYLHVHHEDDEAWHVLEGIAQLRGELSG